MNNSPSMANILPSMLVDLALEDPHVLHLCHLLTNPMAHRRNSREHAVTLKCLVVINVAVKCFPDTVAVLKCRALQLPSLP